jgi:hypothetical protein
MDSSIRAKCARVKTRKLHPYVFTNDWEHFQSGGYTDYTGDSEHFEPGSPVSYCSTYDMCYHDTHDDDERDFDFLFIEPDDSDDSDHSRYFSGADESETEFEEHDRILPKGMRRCLKL